MKLRRQYDKQKPGKLRLARVGRLKDEAHRQIHREKVKSKNRAKNRVARKSRRANRNHKR